MKLRKLDVKDLYSLLKIWKEYRGKDFLEGISTDILVGALSIPRVHIWAIEEKKYFSAFIIFGNSRGDMGEDEIFVDHLYVKPTKRKRGAAKMLLQMAFDEAQRSGTKKVKIKCGLDSFGFAEKMGFKEDLRILSKGV